MTRNEAIKVVKSAGIGFHRQAETLVDMLAELGVLKLDKPLDPDERAIQALMNSYAIPSAAAQQHILCLKAAGLKIVEDDKS